MKTKEITVSGLIKVIESGKGKKIRLNTWQLAQLFGVYESTVNACIKAVIKSEIIIPSFDCPLVQTGKTFLPEVYDLEMIVALAFRLNSADTSEFRKWIIEIVIYKNDNFMIRFGMNNFQFN